MDANSEDSYVNEDVSPTGEKASRGNASEVLTRLELDMAYSNEKALNLEILLLHVADRASDYEAVTLENEDVSNESVVKAFEFNILSGILYSEVKELDNFMVSLYEIIVDAGKKLPQSVPEEYSVYIEEKLHDAEESLKQSQDLVADIKMQSTKHEGSLGFSEHGTRTGADTEAESGQYSPTNAKWKLQNVEQQRHFLQMLEKSLARELDLEKKLSDSRYIEEELKLKLHYVEREAYSLEESMEVMLERMFEAENAAELLLGISHELKGKLQTVQFNLKNSIRREHEVSSNLEESMKKLSAEENAVEKLKASFAERENLPELQSNNLKDRVKEAEDKCNLASAEVSSLKQRVSALVEQLRESDTQLQLAKASAEAGHEQQQSMSQNDISKMENVIEGLNKDVLRLESRAESAETKCTLLTKTNLELYEQLGFLRNNGTEKAISLERKLKESDTQLEHAKVSVEAIEEQQNMLYSALGDMENLIADLKGKVSKAENRAECAESKCTLLTETNLELKEELDFLRSRIESLELSLNQADDAKIAAAKDIGIRTKFITDLVMKLALERERLQLQMSVLAKRYRILAKKCLKSKDNAFSPCNTSQKEFGNENEFSVLKSPEEALTECTTTNFQVEKWAAAMPVSQPSMGNTVPAECSLNSESKVETVRNIEASQLNKKFLSMAVLVVLVSFLAMYVNWDG